MAKKQKQNPAPHPISRPPIVVVMGHIDHGKTTLLDYIRKTKVTESESGGITQHVGAYEVIAKDKAGKNRTITFIDTPGHAAFSKIRERGAKIADVAILVVAADDGVKEQTVEALNAIKDAKIPFVVAINKIDKENANPEKTKKDLAEKEVYIEEWGGKTPCVLISAKAGKNIDELLEMVLLVSDMEELKTDPAVPATGFVLESRMDPKRGAAATLIIQNGTLKQGMCAQAKDCLSPVRIFENFLSKPIKEAGASAPVQITGWNKLPGAGDPFQSFSSKKDAEKSICECLNTATGKTAKCSATPPSEETKKTTIPVLIKADVLGSVEAIQKQIKKLENERIKIEILKAEAGDIGEDDIKTAGSGKDAIVIGFRVKCSAQNCFLAEKHASKIKIFDIIYEMEDWLKKEIEERTPKDITIQALGKIKILKIFNDEKNKKIIGGEVIEGEITGKATAKILRRDIELGVGQILEIKKFQQKINKAEAGDQIGILIQTKIDLAPRDVLEVFELTR